MSYHDGDAVPAGRIWVADLRPGQRVAQAVGRGLIAAGCILALGWAWAPRIVHVAFDQGSREVWFVGVAQMSLVGCFVGALAGQVKVGARLKWTSIGFMLGGLAGLSLIDLLPPWTFDPVLMYGPVIGGFLGFFSAAARRTEEGIEFAVRPDRGDRPPLWDREVDG